VLNQSETWLKADIYRQDKRAAAKNKLPTKLKKNVKEQINSQLQQIVSAGMNQSKLQAEGSADQQPVQEPPAVLNNLMQGGDELGESIIIEKFKNKMGTVLSSMSMQFEAEPGMTVPIMISVLNKSNSTWPRHPALFNVNTNESIVIEEILKPQEQTKVQYNFTVAADESKSVIVN